MLNALFLVILSAFLGCAELRTTGGRSSVSSTRNVSSFPLLQNATAGKIDALGLRFYSSGGSDSNFARNMHLGWSEPDQVPKKIALHHTAFPSTDSCAEHVTKARQLHVNQNGWIDLGYNFVICSDSQGGGIYLGRPGRPRAAWMHNKGVIHIVLAGNFENDAASVSDSNIQALLGLLALLDDLHSGIELPNYDGRNNPTEVLRDDFNMISSVRTPDLTTHTQLSQSFPGDYPSLRVIQGQVPMGRGEAFHQIIPAEGDSAVSDEMVQTAKSRRDEWKRKLSAESPADLDALRTQYLWLQAYADFATYVFHGNEGAKYVTACPGRNILSLLDSEIFWSTLEEKKSVLRIL